MTYLVAIFKVFCSNLFLSLAATISLHLAMPKSSTSKKPLAPCSSKTSLPAMPISAAPCCTKTGTSVARITITLTSSRLVSRMSFLELSSSSAISKPAFFNKGRVCSRILPLESAMVNIIFYFLILHSFNLSA